MKNIALYLTKAARLDIEEGFTFVEARKIKEWAKGVKLKPVPSPVDKLRLIKDSTEIKLIKNSMRIVERVFAQVKKQLKKGIFTEISLAELIRRTGMKHGAEDVSFNPIVAGGINAVIPHHSPSNKRLRPGETIILDFGFKYQSYCSDFTRTVFLKSVPKRIAQIYNQVEKAYNESIALLSSSRVIPEATSVVKAIRNLDSRFHGNDTGITGKDVYQTVTKVLAQKHLDKYFIHNLGHGTGLEIHELPNLSETSKDILQDNMVFSIEPGVYLPKLGGVRIEDLVYLSHGKPKKFIHVSTKLEDNII